MTVINLRLFIHFYSYMKCALPVDISTAVAMSIFNCKLNLVLYIDVLVEVLSLGNLMYLFPITTEGGQRK
jgi:hypothetical protein